MTRTETIIANAFLLPSFVTPQIEAKLGRAMELDARKSGQFRRTPSTNKNENPTAQIDLEIMALLSQSSKPMERNQIAKALNLTPDNVNTPLQRLRMRGSIVAILKSDRRYSYTMEKTL